MLKGEKKMMHVTDDEVLLYQVWGFLTQYFNPDKGKTQHNWGQSRGLEATSAHILNDSIYTGSIVCGTTTDVLIIPLQEMNGEEFLLWISRLRI